MPQRGKNETRKVTACTMDCPDACSLVLARTEDGRVKVKGNFANPFTSGFTCAKIRDHVRRIQGPDRITHPQLKSKAGWKTISWDNALDMCAAKIQNLRSRPTASLHIRNEGANVINQAPDSQQLINAFAGATSTVLTIRPTKLRNCIRHV